MIEYVTVSQKDFKYIKFWSPGSDNLLNKTLFGRVTSHKTFKNVNIFHAICCCDDDDLFIPSIISQCKGSIDSSWSNGLLYKKWWTHLCILPELCQILKYRSCVQIFASRVTQNFTLSLANQTKWPDRSQNCPISFCKNLTLVDPLTGEIGTILLLFSFDDFEHDIGIFWDILWWIYDVSDYTRTSRST